MAKEIIMPKFGFNQEESEILEWLKVNGDKVEKGDPIAVVSTDKISMEVEAPESGTLNGIHHKVGDIVPVTQIIAYILQPGEKVPEADAGKRCSSNGSGKFQTCGKSGWEIAKASRRFHFTGCTTLCRRKNRWISAR